MTFHRWEKADERAQGFGHISRKGAVIANASYNLGIETEEVTARSFVVNEARFARKTVTGEISLLDGARLPGDDNAAPAGSFTLILDDGREVDFRVESCVLRQNPARQECLIRGSGNRM